MNLILNSQEFFTNSWNPFLTNCNTKGHSLLQLSTWLLHLRADAEFTPLSVVTHGGTYIQSSVLCKKSSNLAIQMRRWRGSSKCFENLGKTNQDRNRTLQKTHILLWPQTFVAGTRGNQCQRDGVGKDRSKLTERLQRQGRNSTLEKSRTYWYQTAACPLPGPGGHTTLYHNRATLCSWHQEFNSGASGLK